MEITRESRLNDVTSAKSMLWRVGSIGAVTMTHMCDVLGRRPEEQEQAPTVRTVEKHANRTREHA